VAQTSDIAALRARLEPHGYHVFIQPDRPSGWLVIVTGGREPVTTRAPTRAAALETAERLFVHHRLRDLDSAIRGHGLAPPVPGGTHAEHVDVLHDFAKANDVPH
jgi:hypothetical protein